MTEKGNAQSPERRDFIKTLASATAGLVVGAEVNAPAKTGTEDPFRGAKRKGLLLPWAENDYELGREFLEDPEGTLRRMNMTKDDIVCPEEVHEAFERGKAFAAEVESLRATVQDPLELLARVRELAPVYFGEGYRVAINPFGLKFKERLHLADANDGTATGTFTVTFGDTDADLDE
jgi:hypothetical protein